VNKTVLSASEASALSSRTGTDTVLRRGIEAVGLQGIALIHLLDLPDKLEEAPYMGVLFIALIIASLALAWMLTVRDNRIVWLAAGGLAASVIVGYTITRTVGLPGAMDDIGNWLEPLGMASLFVEAIVVLTALSALRRA
jgi:hypothetical protein